MKETGLIIKAYITVCAVWKTRQFKSERQVEDYDLLHMMRERFF